MVKDNLFYDSGRQHAPKPNDRLNNSRRTATVQRFIIIMIMMIAGVSGVWGQTTLKSIDFSSWTNQTISTTSSSPSVTLNDVYFYCKRDNKDFSIVNEGLTFPDNNMSGSNDFAAVKVTGVNGSITINFIHSYSSSNACFYYTVVDNATEFTTSPGNPTEVKNSTQSGSDYVTSVTVNNLASSNVVVYFGRKSSNFTTIKGITVTTPIPTPTISTQPVGASYYQNTAASALSVTATGGTPSYTYQWYSNTTNSYTGGTLINGATSSTYTPSTEDTGTTYYYCVVTDANSQSVTSNLAPVAVVAPVGPVDLTDAEFGWPSSSASVLTNGTPLTLVNTHNLSATITSSNTAVATIDGSGNTTLTGTAGITVITASFAGDASYNAKTVSYTLIVSDASSLTTVTQPWSIDFSGGYLLADETPSGEVLANNNSIIKNNVEVLVSSGKKAYDNASHLYLANSNEFVHFQVPANSTITVTAYGSNKTMYISTRQSSSDGLIQSFSLTGSDDTYTANSDNASDIYITNSGGGIWIKSIAVTEKTVDQTYTINIEDLRYPHNIGFNGVFSDLTRKGIEGFDITFSEWMSYNATFDNGPFTIIPTNNNNSHTITFTPTGTNADSSDGVIIKQITLKDANGVVQTENFNGNRGQAATITFTAVTRPNITAIEVVTDKATTSSKQNVVLSYADGNATSSSGSTTAGQSDYSLGVQVYGAIGSETAVPFRHTFGTISNNGSNVSYYTMHLSSTPPNQLGLNTGDHNGVATITSTFSGNKYYNVATAADYTLTITGSSDARFSKSNGSVTGNSDGTVASSDLPVLSTAQGYNGTVTYSCSDPSIVTIDSSTGEITSVLESGTVTITASASAENGYIASTATYTLTVTKNTSATLVPVTEHYWKFDDMGSVSWGYELADGNTLEVFGEKVGQEKDFVSSSTVISTEDGSESFTKYIKFNGGSNFNSSNFDSKTLADNNRRYFHFKVNPVANTTKVIVYGWSGSSNSTRSAAIAIGSTPDFSSPVARCETNSNKVAAIGEYTFTSNDQQDVWVYIPGSTFCIAGIKVTQQKIPVSLSFMGGQTATNTINASTDASNRNSFNGRMINVTSTTSTGNSENPFSITYDGTTKGADFDAFYGTENINTSNRTVPNDLFTITCSNEDVIDISSVWFNYDALRNRFSVGGIKEKGVGGSAVVRVKYNGNSTYAESNVCEFTLTVNGPSRFRVVANNQTVQLNQKGTISPYITDTDGNQLYIASNGDGTYEVRTVNEEEGEKINYADFFDFTFTAGDGTSTDTNTPTWSNIVIDGTTGNITTTRATDGDTRSVTVVATPKAELASYFTGTATTTAQVTITAKNNLVTVDFFWDENLTIPVVGTTDRDANVVGRDWVLGKSGTELANTVIFGKSGTYGCKTATNFQDGFPNGRMVYAKVNVANTTNQQGGDIYFSIARNDTAKVIESRPNSSESGVYLYRRGIPIILNKNDQTGRVGEDDYISLIVVCIAPDGSVDGAVSKCRFYLKSHEVVPVPTYSPLSYPNVGTVEVEGDTKSFSTKINKQTTTVVGKIMDTSESVVAYGEGASDGVAGRGNLVYGKFSTSTEYETEQLINENAVKFNYDNVPVISTEVAARRFTSVQIRKISDSSEANGYGEYISPQTLTYYWYEFDTQMTLTNKKNGKSFSETSIYTQNSLNKVPVAFSAKDSVNYVVTWINKGQNAYQGSPVRQEVLSYYKTTRNSQGNDIENYTVDNTKSLITYEIINWSNRGDGTNNTNANADDIAIINTATGLVTARYEPGWVTVAVKYAGGETHGGSSSKDKNTIDEPQYTSTTAPTLTTFTVYVKEAGKEVPTITPTSRKFTQSQTYTIEAPKGWDVYYTLDGTTPTVGTGTYLAHGQSFTSATTSTITVKAIAYDPVEYAKASEENKNLFISQVVQETYTKVDPLPDPYFDPDGVPSPYYYYTSTLKVDIADAYSGAQIFYTMDGSDPTPDYSNTSTKRYSGMDKLIISGNQSIKAIAFVRLDDGSELYSNIVTSNYIYTTDMPRPYFVIKYKNTNQWLAPDASATADSYGNKVQNWTGVTVKGWQDGETVYVDRDTRIMVVNPADGGVGTTYYTLDGSTPNEENSIRFTGAYNENDAFYVIKTTTGTAFVMYEGATSKTGTAVFTPKEGTDFHCWEAVPATTPGGVLNASTRVISTNQSKVSASDGKLGTGVLWDTGTTTYGKRAQDFAQEGITVTFGGFDNAAWTTPDIGQKGEGTPVDGVGQYSIRAGDVAAEINDATDKKPLTFGKYEAFQNICNATSVYAKSFGLPAQGGYVKFEPEKNGYLAIYLVQQGALNFKSGAKYSAWFSHQIKRRAVYLIDEQGKTVPAELSRCKTTATLNENWDREGGEGWITMRKKEGNSSWYPEFYGCEHEPDLVNADNSEKEYQWESYYTKHECEQLFDFYITNIIAKGWNVGDPISPLNIHSTKVTGTQTDIGKDYFTETTKGGSTTAYKKGSTIEKDGTYTWSDRPNAVTRGKTSETDGVYGYVLPSNGYVKYVFPVEAGKTYFFLGDFTKIGIRGFNFVPGDLESGGANADNTTTLAINENNGPSVTNGTKVRATLTRTVGNADGNGDTSHSFKANTWAAIVLPFSVSSTKVEEIFGAGTEIIHFRGIDVVPNQSFTTQPTVNFEQHWHRMIIAGVPCLIKPTQDVASTIEFGNVTVEATDVVPVSSESSRYGCSFTFTGSYAPATIQKHTMYIGNDGKLYQLEGAENASVKGTRAWITGASSSLMANEMPVFITDYNGEWYQDYDSDLITLIQGIADDMNARENGTLNGREGVYTLGGQLVRRDATDLSGLASGVYIVNGKKMVIK